MGFSRQEYWSRLPFPSPGDLPNPGIEPGSPALQADALLSEPPTRSPNLFRSILPECKRTIKLLSSHLKLGVEEKSSGLMLTHVNDYVESESESRSIMSDSLRPHGLYSSWNSLGQNTGWSGQPFPSPGHLPNPGIEPRCSILQADSIPAEPQGKPKMTLLPLSKSLYSNSENVR